MVPTLHDFTHVSLYACDGLFGETRIAFEQVQNSRARKVANDLLKNATEIYTKHKNKPSGVITEIDPSL